MNRAELAGVLVVGAIFGGIFMGSGTALFVGFIFACAIAGATLARRRYGDRS